MNILMIYPETPLTFWSFKDALKFVGKKSAEPPLIFIGIETPNNNSLDEYGNTQNQRRDFVLSVKRVQNRGFIVSGGFIIGFDNDPSDIFDQQIKFIQVSEEISSCDDICRLRISLQKG